MKIDKRQKGKNVKFSVVAVGVGDQVLSQVFFFFFNGVVV